MRIQLPWLYSWPCSANGKCPRDLSACVCWFGAGLGGGMSDYHVVRSLCGFTQGVIIKLGSFR